MLHSTMLLIARTDAETASLISSTVDINDHQYILGTTKSGSALAEEISEAETRGATSDELQNMESRWFEIHKLCTFNEGLNLLRL